MIKFQLKKLFLTVLIFISLFLGGCVDSSLLKSQQPGTSTPTDIIFLPSITPSSTPKYSAPTPVPTLRPEQEMRVAELLQSEDCKIPCYLGITPGKTTLIEANKILENLGAHLGKENYWKLDIGNPLAPNETPGVNEALVYSYINLSQDKKGLVQLFQVNTVTERSKLSLETFRKYWPRYSARGIFAQLGLPDNLYTGETSRAHNGEELIIIYERIGAYIRMMGTQKEINICPEEQAPEIHLMMDLFDPDFPHDVSDFNELIGNPSYWPPVEKVIGVDKTEFYHQVISDPDTCFEPLPLISSTKTPTP